MASTAGATQRVPNREIPGTRHSTENERPQSCCDKVTGVIRNYYPWLIGGAAGAAGGAVASGIGDEAAQAAVGMIRNYPWIVAVPVVGGAIKVVSKNESVQVPVGMCLLITGIAIKQQYPNLELLHVFIIVPGVCLLQNAR